MDKLKELKLKQEHAYEASMCAMTPAEKAKAVDAYNATVNELVTLLGPDAHCCDVDMDTFSVYSDLYKDRNNIRPRFHTTLNEAKAWIEAC